MLRKKLGIECIERNWKEKYISSYFKIPSTLIIPEGCVRVGKSGFWGCEKLREVIIPKSVEEIGYRAFDGCLRTTIILKKPMREFKSIGCNAFWNLLYVRVC